MRQVFVWTDGSIYSPDRRWYGAIGGGIIIECEAFRDEWAVPLGEGTSQQAELGAIKAALELLIDRPSLAVVIYTDSQYCVGVLDPEKQWKLKHNLPLIAAIRRLRDECGYFTIQWVRGHNHDPNNNRCDYLAAIASGRKECPEGLSLSRLAVCT